jgi:NDP-sugar pyrophosphorylase family protein
MTPSSETDSPVRTAIILAGGLGTRLRAALPDIPKVLAPVAGRPFLSYLLDQVATFGLRRVILCTGYGAERIEKACGAAWRGLEIACSREEQALGTGGALRRAAAEVADETVLVLNGDSYCGLDFEAFRKFHFAHGGGATLALKRLTDARRFGTVAIAEDGRIREFHEKNKGASGEALVNGGVYLIRRDWLTAIAGNDPVSLERDIFPGWVGNGFHGMACEGPFIDIGVPDCYEAAQGLFRKGTIPRAGSEHS